jgi:hypothetical protein
MTRVLVVANRTASTPALLAEVGARARAGASVTVLIPPEKADHPDWSDEEAARLVGQAADQEVACLDAGRDALDTIHAAVGADEFDELIVCTKPEHLALGPPRPPASPRAPRPARLRDRGGGGRPGRHQGRPALGMEVPASRTPHVTGTCSCATCS